MQQHSPEPATRLTNKDWIVRSDEPNPWFKKPGPLSANMDETLTRLEFSVE